MFVDDFYFQCMATKTSKALQDALIKEEKAKTQPGMETDFTLTEESVRDIVQAEVQHLSQKVPHTSRGRSRRRDNAALSNVNKVNKPQRRGRGRSSSKGKNNRQPSQSAGRKQKQRGPSSGTNRRVSLPKNVCGTGTGHGT